MVSTCITHIYTTNVYVRITWCISIKSLCVLRTTILEHSRKVDIDVIMKLIAICFTLGIEDCHIPRFFYDYICAKRLSRVPHALG